MIITSKLGATADVDAAHGDAGVEATQGMMRAAVIREGENVGAFIKPESVWFEVRPPTQDTRLTRVHAMWSPDPSKGCQLRGGALDGQVVAVNRQEDGRPPEHLRFPDPGMPEWASDSTKPPLSQSTNYTLSGIDSSEDQWVYEASA